MLRYLCQFQRVQRFSKQLQAQKKLKTLMKPKPIIAQMQEKERMNKIYFQFQAIKTDPLEIIRLRFIKKKQLMGDRKFYMPNKRAYMLQLDNYLREIQANHKEEIPRDNYTVPKTIGEKIELQMKHEKLRFYLNFLHDDKWVIYILSGSIFLMALYEIVFCYRY